MKELREILARIEDEPGPAVLATVVDVKGSSYRLPGAKMLVLPDGSFVGTVSGGCIEADVLERAKRVLETGTPELFLYDTTGDESSVFSLNMGCKGIVRILLEKVDGDSDYLDLFRRSIFEGEYGFAATRLGEPGIERTFFDGEGRPVAGEAAGEIEKFVRSAAAARKNARRPAGIVEIGPDDAEYFVEAATPPRHLLILGAGADAIPLADLAHRIGWRVTIADHRPAYAADDRFPDADRIVVGRPEELVGIVDPGPDTAAVVMSHNFGNDKGYLAGLLQRDVAYIGALGPKVRTAEMLEAIENELSGPDASLPRRLHAPVGLDIGGTDPESIAVSIIAEVQAVLSGREGGFLADREGRIYDS